MDLLNEWVNIADANLQKPDKEHPKQAQDTVPVKETQDSSMYPLPS